MLVNGDKLVVTKKVASFLNEGDIVEVTNVSDDGIISFAFGDCFMHMGVMNIAECEAHFKKIEDMVADVAVPEITEEYILEILNESELKTFTTFDKCTIVSCKLPNGFVITEYSACVNTEDYDEEIGIDICLDKIKDKVWELEAYRLQQYLYESESDCCCENCDRCYCEECECEECEDEFDECLDTDLDCDDCEDFSCPFNSNIKN